MATSTPIKGVTKNEGDLIIAQLKEKLNTETTKFQLPTAIIAGKKKMWTKKDESLFNNIYVGKKLIEVVDFCWVNDIKSGGIVVMNRIGEDALWTLGVPATGKGRFKTMNTKLMTEICFQVTGKRMGRFSIVDQSVYVTKFVLEKYDLVDAGGAKDVTKFNVNDAYLIMNIMFHEEYKKSILNIFKKDGRQALDGGKEFTSRFRFIRSVFSAYQSEENANKYCTVLKESSFDNENGLKSQFYNRLVLENSKR